MPKLHGNQVIQMSVFSSIPFMLIFSILWDLFTSASEIRMSFETS